MNRNLIFSAFFVRKCSETKYEAPNTRPTNATCRTYIIQQLLIMPALNRVSDSNKQMEHKTECPESNIVKH